MRVLSGIQTTGNLHLGNYLGAIKNWVKMQDEAECLYFLADLHAITVHNDPAELRRNTREMAAALIAAGIDPERSTLFNQAQVPAHAELAWLLNGTARIGWMNRMTQFKEKSGKNREAASVGLYVYPVLMAADILLYQATHVPVGDDQRQHLELTRDIAVKFNADFGREVFTMPQPYFGATATRVMSLRDGSAKMSKSDPSDMSRINLSDDSDSVAQKVRKAKTDPEPLPDTVEALDARPEARNLVNIYASLSDQTLEQVLGQYAGQGFGQFKPALADLLVETLRPITARFNELRGEGAELDAILQRGAEKARALAQPTLDAAYQALGLVHATSRAT